MSLFYERILAAIQTVAPSRIPSQLVNPALLINAILLKRTLCLSAVARTHPTPAIRRVPQLKHDLLHRLKRLERFLNNPRVDAQGWQLAFVPDIVAKLGSPRWLGRAIDWTYWDSTLPDGTRLRYQVLRLAVPRCGRAVPLLQLAYDLDYLPAHKSQNQLEAELRRCVPRITGFLSLVCGGGVGAAAVTPRPSRARLPADSVGPIITRCQRVKSTARLCDRTNGGGSGVHLQS